MEVLKMGLNTIQASKQSLAACIGFFDGLHRGHQRLVQSAIAAAKKTHSRSALITFDPDPWCVLKGIEHIDHLTTMEERCRLAEAMGIETMIILEFTKELADLSPQDFVDRILIPLNLTTLVCGFDYHYGKRGQGNVETLKKQCFFHVEVIEEVDYLGEKISSTRIEKAVKEGNMTLCEQLLGRPYSLHGIVERGNQVGTNVLGFPTANLALQADYVLPQGGVYVGGAEVDGKIIKAMINIGHNPTCNHRDQISVEAHLIDFSQNLYNQPLTIYFYEKIRGEIRFNSVDELIHQLNKDRQTTIDYQRKEEIPCV